MEEPLLAVDIVLVLEGQQKGVSEVGFKWFAGMCGRTMLVFAYPNGGTEEFLHSTDRRVFEQR
jgi:hypothetical protein